MNNVMKQLLSLLIILSAGTVVAAEVAEVTTTAQPADTVQNTVDRAADAAEEAADEAVESLTEETKLDLEFSLDRPHTVRVAANSR